MNLQDSILGHLRNPSYQPVNEARLARELGIGRKQHGQLRHTLRSLLSKGDLRFVSGDKIALPPSVGAATAGHPRASGGPGIIIGRIQFRVGGSAVVIPRVNPGASAADSEPIQISYDDTSTALQGDTVEVRLNHPRPVRASRAQRNPAAAKRDSRAQDRANERRGRVVNVLERGSDIMIGTLRRIRSSWYVQPDDPRFIHEVSVADPSLTLRPSPAAAQEVKTAPKKTKGKAPAREVRPVFKPVPRGTISPAADFPSTDFTDSTATASASSSTTAPEVGDKVVVRLREWKNRHAIIEGEVIERLGKTFEPGAEFAAILRKYGLDPSFPDAVVREAASIPTSVRASDTKDRLDYREVPTFTIDPDDAKDFDDALSIEQLDEGRVRIGIHIADVSHYVKPGSALDTEARKRGNSTYLVGAVIPMLPEKLSNGLCSLVEAQDRLVKTVLLTFDAKRRLVDTAFGSAVIRSRKRLTYRQAYALLFQKKLADIRALPLPPKHQTGSTGRALTELTDAELRDLQGWVRELWAIASTLRRQRMRNGSLDLDMPETKVFVDENGYADRLEKIENDESHQLIEEFMLAANEAVARLTKTKRLPSLYRVHDEPDVEKLAEFRDTLAESGIKAGDLSKRSELTKVTAALDQHPQGHLLRTQLLRSLKKACYRATPDGHFGLAKRDYTHFTSPIRRYSDLVVHRVLARHLGDSSASVKKTQDTVARMTELGEHLSLTETNSQEAERESVKVKLVEFFERELTKKPLTRFSAIITDVRPQGLFIELAESMTFGFIPTAELSAATGGDAFYSPTPDGTALATVRRGLPRYELGGKLDVAVSKVDRFKRLIDFKPADKNNSTQTK